MGWNFSANSANTSASARPPRARAGGAAAHGDVIVDVDDLAGESARQEPGDEQRHVPEPLQAAVALLARACLECLRQQDDERLEAPPGGGRLEQRVRAREQRQHIHHVMLGLTLDRQTLVDQRRVQRILEVFLQIDDRLDFGFGHRAMTSRAIPSYMERYPFDKADCAKL
jgi:hypothetical protein